MAETVAGRADVPGFERRALGDAVAEFARRELGPRALALDTGDREVFDACWSEIRQLGLDRAVADDLLGGSNLGAHDLLMVIEELASGEAGIALCVLTSNVALALSGPQDRALLRDAYRVGLVPAGLGSLDAQDRLRVAARTNGRSGRSSVSGHRTCALGAWRTDALVLDAVSEESAVVIVVPVGADGLKVERDEAQMGLRAAPAASLDLDGVEAAPCEPGKGALGAESAHSLLRLGMAAIARGISRRARDLAFAYAQTRKQGGVAIVEHGAVRDMMGGIEVRLGGRIPGELEMTVALRTKVAETDAAVETTCDAVQVMGGAGYMRESGLEKLMRDAKYCQLYPEPNWVARDVLARA